MNDAEARDRGLLSCGTKIEEKELPLEDRKRLAELRSRMVVAVCECGKESTWYLGRHLETGGPCFHCGKRMIITKIVAGADVAPYTDPWKE